MEKKPFEIRKKSRIILFTCTLVVVLLISTILQTIKANKYEQEATITKQMALSALDENLNNISTNLEKTIYVSTPTMLSKLSAELWRESSGAKSNLSLLPTGESTITNTYKFLSQVGEFVMSLERKSAFGEKLTDDDRKQLKNLYSLCNKLNEQINQMCHDMHNGNFSFEEINSTIMSNNDDIKLASQGFDDTEQALTDLPTLIYDGPFSDHITQGEPKLLKNLKNISQEEALKIAKEIYDVFNLPYILTLSTRPDGFMGNIETWNKAEKELFFNGKQWTKTAYCEEREGYYPFFADADMSSENYIEIEY